jgi:L,D-peptidoglycan transpeptidase YkuD (ErfK/YbiS/YcfS/YnhG family)
MIRRSLRFVRVRRASTGAARGLLYAGPHALPVAIGRSGIRANKYEGDGATPRGCFRLVRLWWRADRAARPPTRLPIRRIERDDGWSEDPADRNYNRPVRVAAASSADRLWREDALYDFLIELDHNTRPRIARRGSAVFIHVARRGLLPTAGCVALPASALRRLLPRLSPKTRILID